MYRQDLQGLRDPTVCSSCRLLTNDSSLNNCRVQSVHRCHPVGLSWVKQRKQLQLKRSIHTLLCSDRSYQPDAQHQPESVTDSLSKGRLASGQPYVDPLNAVRIACDAV